MKIVLALLVILAIAFATTQTKNSCECEKYTGEVYDEASHSCKAPATPVTNCVEYGTKYDDSTQKFSIVCFYCDTGYILVNNTCTTEGSIDNCWYARKEDNTNKCSKCADGYYINSSNTCTVYPSTDPNCLKFRFGDGKVYCSECYEGYFKKNDKCIANDIDNCDYQWFTEGVSKCSTCADGYHKSKDQKSCEQDPTSVQGCIRYHYNDSAVECYACDPFSNLGLKGKACVDVGNAAVEGCGDYEYSTEKSAFYCTKCAKDSKYTYEEIQSQSQQYYSYRSIKSCNECPYIEEENSSSTLQIPFALLVLVALLI